MTRNTFVMGVAAVVVFATVVAGYGAVLGTSNPNPQPQVEERSPPSPCLPGETLLAKYEWNQTDGTFGFVLAEGDDVISFTINELDDGEESEGPTNISWESTEPVDVVVVQAGGGAQIEQAIEFDTPQTAGSIITEQGISFLAFCQREDTPTPDTPTPDTPTPDTPTPDTPTPDTPTPDTPTPDTPTPDTPTPDTPTPDTPTPDTPTPTPTPDTPTEEPDVLYWQVDFGAGENPPDPPSYWPADLMAALGNSEDGVTENPSVLRQRKAGQLENVTIVNKSFNFDDENNPTSVTVEFEVEEGAETRDLHLASFVLPGPFDEDEIDQQEVYDVANGTFEGGETGQLTVSIPQQSSTTTQSSGLKSVIQLLGLGVGTVAIVLSGRRRVD